MILPMGAIKDLWESERGIVAIALIVACTVLSATSTITPDQWLEYTRWVFITYAASKTVTGVASIASSSRQPDASATSPAAKAP